MKIHFLGTRGEIKPKTRMHSLHAAVLLEFRKKKVMVDCGDGFENRIKRIAPDAIILTHAHPDHAFGLKKGSPCPVWATKETWKCIGSFPIEDRFRHVIEPRRPKKICGILFEAFPVLHSINAPAVGYRIRAGKALIFYVPDLLWIKERSEALRKVQLYIGDGATLKQNMIRKAKRTGELIGHTTVSAQIGWCQKEGVPKMIVTHCGSAIVSGDERKILQMLKPLAKKRGVSIAIAHDGWTIKVP